MVYSPAGGDESALERRHQQLNQVFGIKQWKHSVRYEPHREHFAIYAHPASP